MAPAPDDPGPVVLAFLPGAPRDGDLVCDLLHQAGIVCRAAPSLDRLAEELNDDTGALLVAEEGLEGEGFHRMLSFLSRQPTWSDLPVVVLSSVPGLTTQNAEAVEALQSSGTVTLIERPVGSETLLAGIRAALRARARQYEVRELTLHLEDLVAERTRKLEGMIAELNAFGYTVAHDLRAPVRAMTSIAEVVLQDYRGKVLNEAGADLLTRLRDAGVRMDALILDLLAYARLAREEFRPEKVSFDHLLAEILDEEQLGHTDVRSCLHVDAPLGEVLGHRVMLKQVLINLVSNALKFVPTGVRPEVSLRSEIYPDRLRLWIHDKGIGIPAGYERKVFGIFERLHPQDYPGTGMGLAIVKQAVTRMNGSVGFESAPGKGSSFWIELPRERPQSPPASGRRSPSRAVRRAD